MFIAADSAAVLIAARAVQGFATGLATATLDAIILDTDRSRGPVLNSITASYDRITHGRRYLWHRSYLARNRITNCCGAFEAAVARPSLSMFRFGS